MPGGHTPAVWFPESEAAVAAILANADPVLVVGAQSSLTGGATPRGETVVSTARLGVIDGSASDHVIVGPGVVLSDLAAALARSGRCYPPIPTYDGATVGGTVATNAAGAATFKHGATRAWVRGLTVMLDDGGVLELVRGDVTASPEGHFEIVGCNGALRRVPIPSYRMPTVPKLAAGYFSSPGMDLVDLFIGAEGTLGVVTSIDLDVLRSPAASLVALVGCPDEMTALILADALRHAAAEARRNLGGGIDVAAIEYLDARSIALVREDGDAERLGLTLAPTMRTALLVQVDLDAAATAEHAAAEIARVDDPTCDTPLVRLCRLLHRHGVLATTIPALPGEHRRRDALFALRESIPQAVNRRIATAQRTIDASLSKSGGDVIVPFDRIGVLLTEIRNLLDASELDHAVWGHLSDGNLHPNVLPRCAADGERAHAAQLAIGSAAIALGGSPLSEHGVGRNPVKQELLRRLYGDTGITAMRAVKRALDPRGVFAPGVLLTAPAASHA
ncbi:MAG: FAD-binding oxidoreductase [Candidatus Binatia bacterium]